MEIADFTLAAAILCLISLGVMLLIAASKLRKDLSEPKNTSTAGIIYAFTTGMLPKAKESASKHMLSYIAGITFHIGIFSAFLFSAIAYLLMKGILCGMPSWWHFPIAILITIGIISGIGLLIKRFVNQRLKSISAFDDYFSNIIANIFLLLLLVALIHPTETTLNGMYIFEAFLFLYIPLGKLRHCAYFFATRVMFGYFYGHRGVLPGNRKSTEK